MPTMIEHAQVLKRIRENPELVGGSRERAAVVIDEYERNIGKALVEMMDRFLPAFGSEELDGDWLRLDYARLNADVARGTREPSLETSPVPAAIDRAVSDGGRVISIEHNSPGGSRGILQWASRQDGRMVVVTPRKNIAEWAVGILEELSVDRSRTHRGSSPMLVAASDIPKLLHALPLPLGRVSTLVLLENDPEQDDTIFEFADRLLAEQPDIVVVHERRFAEPGDMPGTDTIARRTPQGFVAEKIPQKAPRF
jgi:hypothetical protein